nr:golgin candidate 4 [Tanacetum cinerariifolium]
SPKESSSVKDEVTEMVKLVSIKDQALSHDHIKPSTNETNLLLENELPPLSSTISNTSHWKPSPATAIPSLPSTSRSSVYKLNLSAPTETRNSVGLGNKAPNTYTRSGGSAALVEKDEALEKVSQAERLYVEAKGRVSKLEEDNSKLCRALEQSIRLDRISIDSDFSVD